MFPSVPILGCNDTSGSQHHGSGALRFLRWPVGVRAGWALAKEAGTATLMPPGRRDTALGRPPQRQFTK